MPLAAFSISVPLQESSSQPQRDPKSHTIWLHRRDPAVLPPAAHTGGRHAAEKNMIEEATAKTVNFSFFFHEFWLYPKKNCIFANCEEKQSNCMNLEIIEIGDMTGARAHVYSVILEGEEKTLLEQFFEENKEHSKDLKKILRKIHVMAHDVGCLKSFFKEGEGSWADGMVALNGTGRLRLYAIYFHDAVILLGTGGYKPPGVAAYQDYPPLNEKAQKMKEVAKEIYRMIISKELKINEDGTLEVF